MSTTTQFQQLVKPDYVDPADIDVENDNMDKIDKIGLVLCTSGTRPTTNLFEGLQILETDTNIKYVYDGSTWRVDADLNGIKTYTPTTGNVSGATTFGRWKRVSDNLIWVSVGFSAGTVTAGATPVTLSLPSGLTSEGFAGQALSGINGTKNVPAKINAASTNISMDVADSAGTAWGAGNSLTC